MYKIIAIDLDGTLLNEKKVIPRENIKVINKVIDLGYEVVIATGRRYWAAKNLTKEIGRDMTILANNGSVVRRTKNDETIDTKYLEDYHEIIEAGERRGLFSVIHVDKYFDGYDFVIEKDKSHESYNNYISTHEERYKKVDNFLTMDENEVLAIVYAGSLKDMESFYLDLNKEYPGKYNSHIVGNIQVAEALLEILHLRGCKWLSLIDYAKEQGIDPSQIITIGDDNNDLQMIKGAGYGVAMQNANQFVKDAADLVTLETNDQSGVAAALKQILNLKVK